MTGPEKTENTPIRIMVHISFSVYAIQVLLNSLGFCVYMLKFVLKCYVATMRLLHFKDQNLGQILRVDNTYFLRPGHICRLIGTTGQFRL